MRLQRSFHSSGGVRAAVWAQNREDRLSRTQVWHRSLWHLLRAPQKPCKPWPRLCLSSACERRRVATQWAATVEETQHWSVFHLFSCTLKTVKEAETKMFQSVISYHLQTGREAGSWASAWPATRGCYRWLDFTFERWLSGFSHFLGVGSETPRTQQKHAPIKYELYDCSNQSILRLINTVR